MPQDLDIDNYSNEELITLFKLKLPLSETKIKYCVDNSIRKYYDEYGDNNEYIEFFEKCKDKLIKSLQTPKTIQTYDYKFPEGTINPIERRYVTKILNIDTVFRDGYSQTKSTDYLYKLPNPIKKVVSMKISALELPHTWYAFNNANNKIIIDSSQSYIFEFPLGNYHSQDFQTTFNDLSSVSNCTTIDTLIKLSINPHTGKTTIVNKRNSRNSRNSRIKIIFCPPGEQYNNTLGWMLGFRKLTYEFSDSIVSEGAFGSGIAKYLFLEIDDFNHNSKQSLISSTNNSILGNNILGRITISSGHNTLIMDNGSDLIFKQRDYFGPVTIEKLRIRLLDHFGKVLDLNNNDYSFALEFKQLYS